MGESAVSICETRDGKALNGHLHPSVPQDPVAAQSTKWKPQNQRNQGSVSVNGWRPESPLVGRLLDSLLEVWRNSGHAAKGDGVDWTPSKGEGAPPPCFLFYSTSLQAYWLVPCTPRVSLPLSVCCFTCQSFTDIPRAVSYYDNLLGVS